jgi:hypothetical protein
MLLSVSELAAVVWSVLMGDDMLPWRMRVWTTAGLTIRLAGDS